MTTFRTFITACLLMMISFNSPAQDSLVYSIAKQHLATFSVDGKSFKGTGWDSLVARIRQSNDVLIGEDHFTNEIPFFVSAVAQQVRFDNFFCETDPYSAKIFERNIRQLSPAQLKRFKTDYRNVFSFFAFEPEFDLLQQFIQAKTNIYGTDQIVMNADRLICSELRNKTKINKAKKMYATIEAQSAIQFSNFLQDQSKPMYMLTDAFDQNIASLLSLPVSAEEKKQLKDLQLSAKIYREQNHALRIQLMKNNLMQVYGSWENKKNLFKFGTNHMLRSESLLKIFDLGNLVSNIADSKFNNSLHIMLVGKSGSQGSPFKGFPAQAIDENSPQLQSLKPLLNTVASDQWHCIDMLPIRKALEAGQLVVNDISLTRIINGFDYVVIIPNVTPTSFPATE